MGVRILVVIALIGSTASAEWPPPHPLAYFRVDPCLRPPSDSMGSSLGCIHAGVPSPSAAELKRRGSATTELTEVGQIGKLKIYDLWYTRGIEDSWGGDPSLRSILVETAP